MPVPQTLARRLNKDVFLFSLPLSISLSLCKEAGCRLRREEKEREEGRECVLECTQARGKTRTATHQLCLAPHAKKRHTEYQPYAPPLPPWMEQTQFNTLPTPPSIHPSLPPTPSPHGEQDSPGPVDLYPRHNGLSEENHPCSLYELILILLVFYVFVFVFVLYVCVCVCVCVKLLDALPPNEAICV